MLRSGKPRGFRGGKSSSPRVNGARCGPGQSSPRRAVPDSPPIVAVLAAGLPAETPTFSAASALANPGASGRSSPLLLIHVRLSTEVPKRTTAARSPRGFLARRTPLYLPWDLITRPSPFLSPLFAADYYFFLPGSTNHARMERQEG